MGVQLDVPTSPSGRRLWRVNCDSTCFNRLYLYGVDEAAALRRAVDEHGWRCDGDTVLCRTHKTQAGAP
jgi:hypothetical protein